MSLEGVLFGIGNPLLDMIAKVPNDMLTKYKLKANNAILADDSHKTIYDEMAAIQGINYTPGGATQNSIKVAQWLMKEPGACVFSGCIKDDRYGKILNDACHKIGVNTVYQYNTGLEPTGRCACLITDHNRSLVTDLGASSKFTVNHLEQPGVWKCIEKAKFYYISAFFITSCHEALLRVAQHSKQHNKTFCFNLSALFLIELFYDKLLDAIKLSDIVFGNESEALMLSEKAEWGTKKISEIALRMSNMSGSSGGRTVIITQGALPVIVARAGAIQEFATPAIRPEDIVDTTGAGDAFVGGYLAALAAGCDIKECVARGSRLGQLIIKCSGCTMPDGPPPVGL